MDEVMDGDFKAVSMFKVAQSDLGERRSEGRREEKYIRLVWKSEGVSRTGVTESNDEYVAKLAH